MIIKTQPMVKAHGEPDTGGRSFISEYYYIPIVHNISRLRKIAKGDEVYEG